MTETQQTMTEFTFAPSAMRNKSTSTVIPMCASNG